MIIIDVTSLIYQKSLQLSGELTLRGQSQRSRGHEKRRQGFLSASEAEGPKAQGELTRRFRKHRSKRPQSGPKLAKHLNFMNTHFIIFMPPPTPWVCFVSKRPFQSPSQKGKPSAQSWQLPRCWVCFGSMATSGSSSGQESFCFCFCF